MNSGLGGDSLGECLSDAVWGKRAYATSTDACLVRDLNYANSGTTCTFYSAAQMMAVVDYSSDYSVFRPYLEGLPHAFPHICIGGEDFEGQMATFWSPDDPIFFLHHTFVDYIYALWQDANDYDGASVRSRSHKYDASVSSELSYAPFASDVRKVSDTFDLVADYDVSYEKGRFWDNANVDAHRFNINPDWFYTENGRKLDADTKSSKADRRSSDALSRAILEDLQYKYPDAPVTQLVLEQSVEVCLFEQVQSGQLCEPPEGGWNTCEHIERDPLTNDISISLSRLLDDSSLTPCMRETRERMYQWAKSMHQLRFLCAGCYDPFCDRAFLDGKCGLDANEHLQVDGDEMEEALYGAVFDWSVVGLEGQMQIA